MTRDEYMARRAASEPFESHEEVLYELSELQAAWTAENSPTWYLLNRLQRFILAELDAESKPARLWTEEQRRVHVTFCNGCTRCSRYPLATITERRK